jgi:site-specific DNA-methyltransferase (adenine-specific)
MTNKNKQIVPMHNRIYLGDCLNIMSTWPNKLFDACITDPPYNIASDRKGLRWAFSSHITLQDDWDRFSKESYTIFCEAWLKEICRVTKENGNIFIFGSYHNIYTIGSLALKLNLKIINSLIWIKPNAQPNITCRMFTESSEQIIWLCNNSQKKAKNWTFNYQDLKKLNGGKQMRNYFVIPTTPKKEKIFGKHPAQKPLRLMELLVRASTKERDLVLDCFAGAGSTLIACENLNRKWIGIEENQKYCDIFKSRLNYLIKGASNIVPMLN